MKVITNSKWQDTAEVRCYREALSDNFRLLMEVLDVMRQETTCMRDEPATGFLIGMSQAVAAFARVNASTPLDSPRVDRRP